MKKVIFLSLLLLSASFLYANAVQKDLSDGLLRLHIVANSNSAKDQEVKLMVRDRIIKEAGKDFAHIKDRKEFLKKLSDSTDKIDKIANDVLLENGFSYDAVSQVKRLYIPRKTYDGIVLPEGSYEGLVVKLGKAEGENWWCVVYPPLCFTESTSGSLSPQAKEYLKNTLSAESYSLISREGIEIEYKFKIVELVQKIQHKIKG